MRSSRFAAVALSARLSAIPVSAAGACDVVGTWRGSAYEFASFYLQGRVEITVTATPDGRWASVWRQADRPPSRSRGRAAEPCLASFPHL